MRHHCAINLKPLDSSFHNFINFNINLVSMSMLYSKISFIITLLGLVFIMLGSVHLDSKNDRMLMHVVESATGETGTSFSGEKQKF